MPSPTDKEAVQRLQGMTSYVQRFAPGLADATKPLRDLTEKENVFMWDQSHDKAFNEVKPILTKALSSSTSVKKRSQFFNATHQRTD